MLGKVRETLQVLDKKDINYDDLKIQNSKDSICWDDINIRPLASGILHEQKRSGIKAKTLAVRLVRTNKDDLPDPEGVPIIYYTVKDRFDTVTSYRPYALRGRKYKILGKDGNVSRVHEGISEL